MQRSVSVPVRKGVEVEVLQTLPDRPSTDIAVLYAPGAGSNLDDPFGLRLSSTLEERGVESWRLQFPYMQAGRRAPDASSTLEATWRAVIEAAAADERRLVASGRSMGGRIASQVVARGEAAAVAALALFAYPLVPPGRASGGRSEHFRSIAVPVLFCSGTRDAFATAGQLAEAAALVPDSEVHLLEGADHGFSVLKSSGRTREDAWDEAIKALLRLLQRISH